MKSDFRYKDVEKIKNENDLGKYYGGIHSMPYTALVICILLAIVCFIAKKLFYIIFGILLLALVVILLVVVKKKRIIDIYQNGAIIYDGKDDSLGYLLYYDDVVEWAAKNNKETDLVVFTLEDQSNIRLNTFSLGKADRLLNKVMKEKERMFIHLAKIKEEEALGKRASKLMKAFFTPHTNGGDLETKIKREKTGADKETADTIARLKEELANLEKKVNQEKDNDENLEEDNKETQDEEIKDGE